MIRSDVWHYDGRTAARRTAVLEGDGDGFRLIGDGWESGPWQWSRLIAQDSGGAERVYAYHGHEGWRIGFAGPVPDDLAGLLPGKARYGGFIDRIGLFRAAVLLAMCAGVVLFIGLKMPGWVAPLVPQSWEDRMGDAMVGDFGGRYCHSVEGDKALHALIARIDPEGRARSIEVANIPMVNAIALPGRRIILFDGLLEKAESPDEVAGILGHELGHVRHRDTLAALMRQLGLSVILGGVDGRTGAQINTLLGLSYSREAEHRADEAAIEALARANISPAGIAGFFARADPRDKDGGKQQADGKENAVLSATDWFASHPSSRSRRQLFEKAVVKGHAYAPALSPTQWKTLKSMCGDKEKG